MRLVKTFENVSGQIIGGLVEIDGHTFHIDTRYPGEARISPWAPAFDGSPWDNPANDALAAMIADGRVRTVYEGLSAAPDDRDVWVGGNLPAELA